jgi:hypothetical protein
VTVTGHAGVTALDNTNGCEKKGVARNRGQAGKTIRTPRGSGQAGMKTKGGQSSMHRGAGPFRERSEWDGGTSLCGNYLAVGNFGEFHGSFVYPAKLWAFRCGSALRGAFPWRVEPPHPRQVQRRGCQRKLHAYFSQPAHSESPHSSLLFQNSYDRFSQRFPPSV